MSTEPDAEAPPPLPQISLRGLLLFNTLVGMFVSFLTTMGMGQVSLWLFAIWGVIGVLFLIQWGMLWIVLRLMGEPEVNEHPLRDPRNVFPKLPRER